MLEPYKIIIFPSRQIEPWDGIPRFSFLETSLREIEGGGGAKSNRKSRTTKSADLGARKAP